MATKVLVAEDDELLSSLLVGRLQGAGYETHAAYDGSAAIAEAKKWQPDLLILDLLMPVKSGYDVLEAIRADAGLAPMRVIVVSNLSANDDVDKARKYGVIAFLVKANTTPGEITEKVKSILG